MVMQSQATPWLWRAGLIVLYGVILTVTGVLATGCTTSTPADGSGTGGDTTTASSPELAALLEAADTERTAMKDDYLSVEHLLLAAAADASPAGEALRSLGADRDSILAALADLRGAARVTSQDPEATFNALDQYGRDLVDQKIL